MSERNFPETLRVLQNQVDSLVNELDVALWMEDHSILASMDEGDVDDSNIQHCEMTQLEESWSFKRYLDSMAGGF